MVEADEDEGGGQLQVYFLPSSTTGRLGFTVLPGRRGRDETGRFWTRDLEEDLERLQQLRADRLVLLVSEQEMLAARVGSLFTRAEAAGLRIAHHPLPHRLGSEQVREVEGILDRLQSWLESGQTVVLASGDGLGRAPAVGAGFLVKHGYTSSRARELLQRLRGPECLSHGGVDAFLPALEGKAPSSPCPTEPPTAFAPAGATSSATQAPTESAPPRTAGARRVADVYGGERPVVSASEPDVEARAPVDPPWVRVAEDLPLPAPTAHAEPLPLAAAGPAGHGRTPLEMSFVGAVLGAALGDALGAPLEAETQRTSLEARYGNHGPSSPRVAAPPEGDGPPMALISDETQHLALALQTTIEIRQRRLELETALARLAERLGRWASEPQGGHRQPEPSTLEAAQRLADGHPWREVGSQAETGAAGLARSPAFGLAFGDDLARAEVWAAAQSRITQRTEAAVGAAAAVAVGVARAGSGARWEVVTSEMVAAACRYSPRLASRLARSLHDADAGVPTVLAFERLAERTAHDTLAAAMFIVRRHPDDLEGALREAVMTPGDSDGVGSTVGALLGARLGSGALPPRWLAVLERREELEALALALAASR